MLTAFDKNTMLTPDAYPYLKRWVARLFMNLDAVNGVRFYTASVGVYNLRMPDEHHGDCRVGEMVKLSGIQSTWTVRTPHLNMKIPSIDLYTVPF